MMKRKVKTRLLSALLTLAMLACLLPSAFAASYDTGYFDSNYRCDLYDDLEGDNFYDLYREYSFFIITSDYSNSPGVYIGNNRDVEDKVLTDSDLRSVYVDAYNKNYTDSFYSYTVYAYSKESDADDDAYDRRFTRASDSVEIRIYTDYKNNSSSSSSSKGDIYADIDKNGYVDLNDLAEEIYDFAYDELDDYPDYVYFTSSSNGSIYYDDDDSKVSSNDKIRFYDDDDFKDDIYFEITNSDKTASISFTVYDEGKDSVKGTIIINSDESSSSSSAGDIKYSTGYNTSISFKGSDFEGLLGNNEYLEYVKFSLPNSSKGTLYTTSSESTKVAASDKFDSSELDDVTFAPKSGTTGNVSVSFTLSYENSKGKTATKKGTVVISIADGKTITYSCEAKGEVEFSADDFDEVCRDATKKGLEYVKFSLPTSSKGTLYVDGTKVKSSDKFYFDPGKNDYDLNDVTFEASSTGAIEFSYTAYPTSGSSFTGKVRIEVTAGTLTPINYTVTGGTTKGVNFSSNDFVSALKSQTNNSLSSVTFTLPKSMEGTLYYDGSSKVSGSTQYKTSGSANSLDRVSFVPGTGITGNITINYTAKDSRNNTYKGTVVVKTFVGEDTIIAYETNGQPAKFVNVDFQNACMRKLGTNLQYVKFDLPNASQGTLYYGYGTTQQTPVKTNSKYQTSTHLDFVSFLPKAGFSGTATISYTGFDMNETFYYGTITVTVTPPTRSSYFVDASESWIAPAADFLYNNSVYKGVVAGNTLGVRNQATRGEVMQMIYNAFNLDKQVASVTSNFTDVPSTHAYYTAINAANQLGIAQGDQGKFRPNEPITRQDAMTLLYRAFVKLGVTMTSGTASDLQSFGDFKEVSSYAIEPLASMARSGIIQGDAGLIKPTGNVSRGEISVMLYRAMTL